METEESLIVRLGLDKKLLDALEIDDPYDRGSNAEKRDLFLMLVVLAGRGGIQKTRLAEIMERARDTNALKLAPWQLRDWRPRDNLHEYRKRVTKIFTHINPTAAGGKHRKNSEFWISGRRGKFTLGFNPENSRMRRIYQNVNVLVPEFVEAFREILPQRMVTQALSRAQETAIPPRLVALWQRSERCGGKVSCRLYGLCLEVTVEGIINL